MVFLGLLSRYIEDFNKIGSRSSSSSDSSKETEYQDALLEIVENPMNAYHILKRTVIDWEVVAEAIKNHTQVKGMWFSDLFLVP